MSQLKKIKGPWNILYRLSKRQRARVPEGPERGGTFSSDEYDPLKDNVLIEEKLMSGKKSDEEKINVWTQPMQKSLVQSEK